MENSNSSSADDPGMVFLESVACSDTDIKDGIKPYVKEEIVEEEEVAVDGSDIIFTPTVLQNVLASPQQLVSIPFEVIALPELSQAIYATENFNGRELTVQDGEEDSQVEYKFGDQSKSKEESQVTDTDPNGDKPLTTDIIEENVIQLENGTYAYVHSEPQENCSIVKLEDGSTAYITYITVAQDIMEEETVVEETVEMEERTLQVDVKKLKQTFRCTYDDCGRLFRTVHHLKVHERSHTGARPYLCPEPNCLKAFATDYSRKAHIRTHTGEKPYHCNDPHCNKSFKTSGDLQKHRRTHTGEKPFICPIVGCDRSFTTSYIRKVHIRTHTGEKPYVCTHPGCDRSFASATNFKNHSRIHSGEKPFVCDYQDCQKRFTEYSSLYKHNLVHTKVKAYHCDICNRNYRQSSTFNVHKRTFHGIIEAEDGTEIVLGNVFNLSDKQKKLKTLTTNSQEKFRNQHSDSLEAVSTIEVDLNGSSEDRDESHGVEPQDVELKLKDGNSFSCMHPGCKESFTDATSYNDHIRKYFSFLKPFVCEFKGCNRRFTEYSSLCKHHYLHSKSEIKSYDCDVCGKAFTRPSALAIHKQTIHNLFETENGTEFHVSNLAGFDSKKVKTVLSSVLSTLEKDDGSILTLQSSVDQLSDGMDDQNQIYILTEDNLGETLQSINEVTELEAALEPLTE